MDFTPIAYLHTCYDEKFGIPRQSGIVKDAWGELTFTPEYRNIDSLRGLEGFSHLWLIFIFHQAKLEQWKPTVRPPRLGGNAKVGVFASRSPFRPNPIGMSCVEIDQIDYTNPQNPIIKLLGVDLVDNTPILDIKPYIPYADSIPNAKSGFANDAPLSLPVYWDVNIDPHELPRNLRELIEATLAADPRPAYHHSNSQREYGCLISGYNIIWTVTAKGITIRSYSQHLDKKD